MCTPRRPPVKGALEMSVVGMLVVPAIREVEVGRLIEPKSLRPAWETQIFHLIQKGGGGGEEGRKGVGEEGRKGGMEQGMEGENNQCPYLLLSEI